MNIWPDQDLLKIKENQRRGGVAAKTMLPAVSDSSAANSRLTSASNQDKSNDESPQAFGYTKGFFSGWAAGQKRAIREAEAEHAVISKDTRPAEEARTGAYMDTMDETQAMVDAIESHDALVVDEMRSVLMEAALTLAEAPSGAEPSDRGARAKSALERTLLINDPKGVVKVNVNPQDVETLDGLGVECPVKLVPDAGLNPGGAAAYVPEGLLDARLLSAVEHAHEALVTVQAAEE